MAKAQDQILATVIDSAQSMTNLLGQLERRVATLEQAIPALQKPIDGAVAGGAISTVFIGMLLAEIANGNPSRFDELMARTTSFTEAQTRHLESETRGAILGAINRMVEVADDHFARTR